MNDLLAAIQFSWFAHQQYATRPDKAFRRWDGRTPYAVHPLWCAMTILTETSLSEGTRSRVGRALLLHDVPEDTSVEVPEDTPDDVRDLVQEMTFHSFDCEVTEVWLRSDECLLGKLYDKTFNLLDGVWMSPERRAQYCAFTLRLADRVEQCYGSLNIVRIARAVA